MKTLDNEQDRQEIVQRLKSIHSGSQRGGRMSAHQMICHLNDGFRMYMNEKPAKPVTAWYPRPVLRWFALLGSDSVALGKVSPAVPTGVAATGPATVVPACSDLFAAQPSSPYPPLGLILYAGVTPGAVGLYQVNLQLPQNLPAATTQFYVEATICPDFPVSLQSNTVNLPVQ